MHFQRRAPASLRGITLPQPSGTTETSGDATAKQPSGTEGRPKKKENKNVKKKILFSEEAPLKIKDCLQQKLFVVAVVIVVALSCQFCKFPTAPLYIFFVLRPNQKQLSKKKKS